jgi:hypothetical protein
MKEMQKGHIGLMDVSETVGGSAFALFHNRRGGFLQIPFPLGMEG